MHPLIDDEITKAKTEHKMQSRTTKKDSSGKMIEPINVYEQLIENRTMPEIVVLMPVKW